MALGLVALGAEAQSEQGPAAAAEVPGYCQYVRGVADAQAAVLLGPELFVSGGAVNAGQAGGTGTALGTPRPRLTAGLGYDFVGLYRGLAVRRRAEAECRRHQALSALQAALQVGTEGVAAAPALEARASVLRDTLPQGEQLLASLREEVRQGHATVEELNALQMRLDGLRALAADTERARQRLALRAPLAGQPLPALLEELRAADDALEEVAGGLRRAAAWDVRLRGGYDEVVGVAQTVPLFGTLTVSYNLGGLWQPEANARAREGLRLAAEEDVEGLHRRVGQLLGELRAARRTEGSRLGEVTVLVNDLQSQLREVEALQTQHVRRYRDYLRMELARLRAEQAYLRAHVEGLDAFLGQESP